MVRNATRCCIRATSDADVCDEVVDFGQRGGMIGLACAVPLATVKPRSAVAVSIRVTREAEATQRALKFGAQVRRSS
jgi:hypothetical protein